MITIDHPLSARCLRYDADHQTWYARIKDGAFSLRLPDDQSIRLAVRRSQGGSTASKVFDRSSEKNNQVSDFHVTDLQSVNGGVFLSTSFSPARGAEVEMLAEDNSFDHPQVGWITQTDASGEFHFRDVPEGAYVLSASLTHYVRASKRILVHEGFSNTYHKLWLATSGRIAGKVVGIEEGARARVTLITEPVVARTRSRQAKPDSSGEFVFESVPPGIYQIQLDLFGPTPGLFLQRNADVDLRSSESAFVEFNLLDGIAVHGRVYRGKQVLPNVMVSFRLQQKEDSPQVTARVDQEGEYKIVLPRTGSYSIRLDSQDNELRGQSKIDAEVGRESPQALDLHFHMGLISGKVITPDGQLIPRAKVLLSEVLTHDQAAVKIGQSSVLRILEKECNDDGSFEFKGLRRGTYRVHVSADGHADEDFGPVSMGSDERVSMGSLILGTGQSVRVVTLKPDGWPLVGATVSAIPNGDFDSSNHHNPAGESHEGGVVILKDVKPGSYSLLGSFPGLALAVLDNIVISGDATQDPLLLKFAEGGTIDLQVLDKRGAPVPRRYPLIVDELGRNLTVMYWALADELGLPFATDRDGRLRIRGISAGRYLLGRSNDQAILPQTVYVYDNQSTMVLLTGD